MNHLRLWFPLFPLLNSRIVRSPDCGSKYFFKPFFNSVQTLNDLIEPLKFLELV